LTLENTADRRHWHIWKQMYLEYFQSCNICFFISITIKTTQFIQLYIFAALRLTASGSVFELHFTTVQLPPQPCISSLWMYQFQGMSQLLYVT